MSRPFDDLVAEVGALAGRGVTEVTLLGQNVNSYGRDLTRRRPLFAELLRAVGAVEGIRRVRFTSPHPKDLRPETIAAMAETAEVCNHLHLPLQSGSDAVLAAMRRGYTAERYLARLAAARAAIPDLAVTTDLIVGFPGETEDDFERTLEVAAEAAYDSAYTFIFSPRPGTRAAAMDDRFVPADVVAERFERLRVVVERSALARHRDRIGRVEEVVVEGPSKRDPSWSPAGPARTSWSTSPRPTDRRRPSGSYARCEVTGAARHHLTGELLGVTARPSHRAPHPGRPPAEPRRPTVTDGGRPVPPGRPVVALVGPTASGKSAVALVAAARPTSAAPVELVSVDSMAVYRGMDIGTAKPTPAEQAASPYHLIDLVDPSEEFTVQQFQAAGRRALAGIAGRGHGALLVGGTGLYLRSLVDDLAFPGRYPEVASSLEQGLDAAGPEGGQAHSRPSPPCTTGWPGSTRWLPAASARPTAGAWCGPSR